MKKLPNQPFERSLLPSIALRSPGAPFNESLGVTMKQPGASTDYERTLIENVERFGWHCTSVVPNADLAAVPFSYTVGMYRSFGQPEFLILGLDAETAHSILGVLANAAAKGKMYSVDEPCD